MVLALFMGITGFVFSAPTAKTNIVFIIAGTDPVDPESLWEVSGQWSPDDGFMVEWHVATGRTYSVYSTTNLFEPFALIQGNLLFPQNVYTSAIDQVLNRFFRIQVELD